MKNIPIRKFNESDINEITYIWNSIVEEGNAFPQTESLNRETAFEFFSDQTFTGVAIEDEEVMGLYILHPNNIGRCGHISNASYAVKEGQRGKHIGEKLVRHSMETAKGYGFRILQFNAVVVTNNVAIRLYERLGFKKLGTIPGGFFSKDKGYLDIIPHYIELL